MTQAARWDLVKEKANELKDDILKAFPNIDVECEDRRELTKKHKGLAARGYPVPQQDVDAYLLIRGATHDLEEVAQFAENQAAEISEQTGVWIEILATHEVWCTDSSIPRIQPVVRGQPLQEIKPYVQEDGRRDLVFICWKVEPHKHNWGRFDLQG